MRLLALALACLCERAVAFSPSRARTPTRSVARPVAYLDSLSAPVVVDAAVVGVDVTAAHFAVRIFSRTSFRGDAGPRRGVAEARHPRRGYSAETGALLRYLNSLAAAPGSIKNARPAINEVLKARIDPVADAKRRLLEACDAFEATQRRAAEEAEAAAAAAAAAAPVGLAGLSRVSTRSASSRVMLTSHSWNRSRTVPASLDAPTSWLTPRSRWTT